MKPASVLAPGRWRCHAAVAGGMVLIPALVIVSVDGSVEVQPFKSETPSTCDINTAVMVVSPEAVSLLPPTLPPQGLRSSLTAVAHLTIGGTIAVAIPLAAV